MDTGKSYHDILSLIIIPVPSYTPRWAEDSGFEKKEKKAYLNSMMTRFPYAAPSSKWLPINKQPLRDFANLWWPIILKYHRFIITHIPLALRFPQVTHTSPIISSDNSNNFVYSPTSTMAGVGLVMVLFHNARVGANSSSISNTSFCSTGNCDDPLPNRSLQC